MRPVLYLAFDTRECHSIPPLNPNFFSHPAVVILNPMMNADAHCRKLLALGRRYHPAYKNGLSNHLPMALIALQRMGATPAQLEAFYCHYVPRLEPMPADAETPTSGLKELLRDSRGSMARLPVLRAGIRKAIREAGLEATLRELLPVLIPGVSAAAFHGIIRLAYAVQAEAPEEAAIALAYWAAEYLELGELPAPKTASLEAIAGQLGPVTRNHEFRPGIITDRMAEVAALPKFRAAASQPGSLALDTLAAFALAAYRRTGNFTLLHGVTGCHALRILLPLIDNQERALRYYWQALLVAWLSTGALDITTVTATDNAAPGNWQELLRAACRASDEHVIKMVYTCWAENRHYGQEEYLAAARIAIR